MIHASGGRHDGALDADRDLATVPALEIFDARLGRPATESTDCHRFAALGEPDQDRRDAAKADMHTFEDAGGDPRRDAGIDRVAASLQHLPSRPAPPCNAPPPRCG